MKRYGNKIFVTIMSHKFKVESYSGHFETLNVLKHFLEFEENQQMHSISSRM